MTVEKIMFSIKESLANCLECPLYNSPSTIMETNCKSFDEVEIVFVTENPSKKEVEQGVPLIDGAGQIFRKYFNLYGLNQRKYILTSIVLCQSSTVENAAGNLTEEIARRCKVNCFDIIKMANPKLIVLMGSTPAREFGLLKGTGIVSIRGEMFKWDGYDVLVTTHPAHAQMRRGTEDERNFGNDIKKAGELIGVKVGTSQISENQILDGNGAFYYRIPEKFYTEEYYLLDVQYIRKTHEVLYIFLDKNDDKIYHKENDDYVFYKTCDEEAAAYTVPYKDLTQIKSQNRRKHGISPKISYEGDIKLPVKHAIDYYLTRTLPNRDNSDVKIKIFFYDIETSSKDGFSQSTVKEAGDIISLISYSYGGDRVTYALDPKFLDKSADNNITIENTIMFRNERELLKTFVRDFNKLDPHIMVGWYSSEFDFPYIYNRCIKNGIEPELMSRFGDVYINPYNGRIHIAGIIELDMYTLYKEYTQNKEESYSLDFIANKYLGEGKLGKGYNFSQMFKSDVNGSILYNRQDVDILVKLEAKLKHIVFCNEFRSICKTTFDATKSTIGLLDSLLISYLKPRGIAVKSSDPKEKSEKFTGAYVKAPDQGIHDYISDFDFSSLYPSLIITYNIGINTFVMKFADERNGYYLAYNRNLLPDTIDIVIDPISRQIQKKFLKNDLFKFVEREGLICTINGCFFKSHANEKSHYSEILEVLMNKRKLYKEEMFKYAPEDEEYDILDSKQTALKVLANSMYGGLGAGVFRFFNVDCAKSITLSGQEAIKTSIINADKFVSELNNSDRVSNIEKISMDEMFADSDLRDTCNILTSDTDSLFITYENILDRKNKDKNIELIISYNNMVEKFLNDNVMDFLVKTKNVKIENSRLALKNEYVCNRGLFLTKKRYAMHNIRREGKIIDKIDARGIETRRSDYPSFTKIKLVEMLDILLKSETVKLKTILEFVKDTEGEILGKIIEGEKDIARPVSYGKKLEEYKSISQGVRGMETWNLLEYKTFYVGSRGYLFTVKGIDLDKASMEIADRYYKEFISRGKKLDVIVIPEQAMKLPEYYIVDSSEMLRVAWTDRYKLMLEPLLKITNSLIKF